MKNNIKKLLILFISILALPFIVYADMGAPESYNYDVIITNPKGASLYTEEGKKTNTTIDFDTKITISYERLIKGELYLEYYSEEDEKYGYIKFSDVKLFDEEIDFSQLYENKDKEQYYSYEETKMYKGPSAVYGEIKDVTIPEGTIIDYTYGDGASWIYTEYKGIKGWVYVFDYNGIYPQAIETTVAYVTKNERVLILGDQKVYNNKGDVIGVVKNLTEHDALYYSNSRNNFGQIYIKSTDIEGWVKSTGEFGANGAYRIEDEEYKILVASKNGIALFDDPELQKIYNITIPYGTKIYAKYFIHLSPDGDVASQVEYQGKKYWINANDSNVLMEEIVTIESLGKTKTLYKYNNTEESLNIEVPANEKIISKYNYIEYTQEQNEYGTIYNTWYYIEYQGTKGWIFVSSDPEKEENPVIIKPEDDKEPEEEKNKEKSEGLSPTQIAIMAIVVSAFLAVGALTTILLINKKKKVEITSVAEEEKVVEETTKEEPSKAEEIKTENKKTQKDKK